MVVIDSYREDISNGSEMASKISRDSILVYRGLWGLKTIAAASIHPVRLQIHVNIDDELVFSISSKDPVGETLVQVDIDTTHEVKMSMETV